jgi:hypothetical protein
MKPTTEDLLGGISIAYTQDSNNYDSSFVMILGHVFHKYEVSWFV